MTDHAGCLMKQVAQNYRSGDLAVLDVPVPGCQPGGVLVRSLFSLISTGTELMKVNEARMSLYGKAKSRPDQVRKVLDEVSRNGARSTYSKAMTRLDSYTPLGYSLSGVVIEVGEGAEEFTVGQVVACAGNEHALHAEVNWVPTNLCVPVPDGVDPRHVAFATVGAVAMHGIRRSEPQLGDSACVIGLGLVGQIVVQLLVASGVRVVGIDERPDRCRLAEEAGAVACDGPHAEGLQRIESVLDDLTRGLGADHVLLVAGGASNGPIQAAARLARDRARVTDVGKLRIDVPWNAFYDKELEIRFSRSYGPGRYDDVYELQGIDYPAGYVRWTERRNLQCFVDMLATGKLNIESLVSGVYPVVAAPKIYEQLRQNELEGVGFLFGYPNVDLKARTLWQGGTAARRSFSRPRRGAVRVGFVGAGNYATSALLPHLMKQDDVELARVATTTSLSAVNAQRRFGFTDMSTDAEDVLCDPDIDAVFIVTRHHTHATLVSRSLEAGKATYVEKPLALDDQELAQIADVIKASGNDRLMVGFNRRFAPLFGELRRRFDCTSAGSVIRYTVNAGPLASKSWYGNSDLEGSRFTGEGGHFIDTISWWLDASPTQVYASAAGDPDNLHVALAYEDGSVASVDYFSNGSLRCPKEVFEASSAGRTVRFENFRQARVWAGRRPIRLRERGTPDKGQAAEIQAFLTAVRTGQPMPISVDSLMTTTAATLAVGHSLTSGRPVSL